VERDVAAPVDRVLSKEQTTNADERDDKATERYNYTNVNFAFCLLCAFFCVVGLG